MNIRDYKTVARRREALEKELSISLGNIGTYGIDDTGASQRNCENMIGTTQVPLGVAGPLIIKNIHGKSNKYYIPLATTEGALVASVNRGCKAISLSGGATVNSHKIGTTRAPVFHVHTMAENTKLYEFLDTHSDDLKKFARETSHHLELVKFTTRAVGNYRYIRFYFDTQEAMGMNMVTIATEALVQYIEEQTHARCVSVAGNFDVDKKPSWLNILSGRGIEAWAEATLPSSVLRQILKTSAQEIYDVWLSKCMIGSAVSGSMGFNAHMANVLAAIFLATGQDIAHVVEASCGITTMEILEKGSLHVSVSLPDLMVGTVGGGTGLATQREAFLILGTNIGPGSSMRFAEIIGAAVLAGEISLLSSLSEKSLSRAHQMLARGNIT